MKWIKYTKKFGIYSFMYEKQCKHISLNEGGKYLTLYIGWLRFNFYSLILIRIYLFGLTFLFEISKGKRYE